jgi:hypothetical protein
MKREGYAISRLLRSVRSVWWAPLSGTGGGGGGGPPGGGAGGGGGPPRTWWPCYNMM